MVAYKFCIKCGEKILSNDGKDLCENCSSNHDFSIFLKNLIDSLEERMFLEDADFIRIGINESEINEYIWKLNKLNLIIFNSGKFFIKLDEINKFIDGYYVKDFEKCLNKPDFEFYDPKKFVINKNKKNYKSDVLKIIENINFIEEDPKIPFPQSDDLNRFIFTGQHLLEKDLNKEEIKQLNQIGNRIVNMYTSTGFYFHVFEKYRKNNKIFYKLSDKGKYIFSLNEYDRNLNICKCILEHEIFYRIFRECLVKNIISKDNIINIMLQYDLNLNSMVTIKRRASCVSSWMHWIFRLMRIDI
ncbi:hypothetical protein [Methanobrevibacter sp.]|uniref:DUF7226 domain-containing protein n=1 Tax=Methanobrevibacter sp. TaxID=66852 RepID=UPI003865E1FA